MKYVPPLNGNTGDPDRPFVNGQPAAGIEGSIIDAATFEHPQREITNVITAAGLVPDGADLTQLAQAIPRLASAAAAPGGVGGVGLLPSRVSNSVVNVTAGQIVDGNGDLMTLAAAVDKDLSAAWSLGSGGGLDAGGLAANTGYALHAIAGDDGAADVLVSASLDAPTMPAGYTRRRLIGIVVTDSSSHIYPFAQNARRVWFLDRPLLASVGAGPVSPWQSVATPLPTGRNYRLTFGVYFVTPAGSDNGMWRLYTPGLQDPSLFPAPSGWSSYDGGRATDTEPGGVTQWTWGQTRGLTDQASQIGFFKGNVSAGFDLYLSEIDLPEN
ncbi:hypothetical protein SAMN06265365_15119 [Tistlia consotensis]|uniref:Uncharacterized protein n=1 Tax=Tistlia consotensis USBA 355 TaxID=560819 RepID=A0A1Y6CME2_9PROT|nr:hypothetical protein [Tistlia consotensis]SMF77507.1 hypothetical protein SAMN05428998_13710 [Tistlia consotensis USBA 355]SMF83810.1 hypothetical protein SAMN05428998_15119 [Tistlia consotensis USBA 355]SNS34512.1 hypothetical protein SAMN06265365_15119 [Tistlia consotensis]